MCFANMQKLFAFHECCQYAQMACCCASQVLEPVLVLRNDQMLMLASLPVIVILLLLRSHMLCTKYCYSAICQLVLLLLTVHYYHGANLNLGASQASYFCSFAVALSIAFLVTASLKHQRAMVNAVAYISYCLWYLHHQPCKHDVCIMVVGTVRRSSTSWQMIT